MTVCNFSYDHYADTLREIKKTHTFSDYETCSDNDVILRHDVDVSLHAALQIARIENELGIQSTYFILFHSELYNPFNTTSSEIIRKILRLGHRVGLHYNSSFIIQNGLDPSETIRLEIELMENHFNTNMNAISPHDPGLNEKLTINPPAE